jgi:molybdate transport system ATP-binding protein
MAGPGLHVHAVLHGGPARAPLSVDFEVPPGVTILFGPSGAGKSTLLLAIAGLLRPDAGRISLGGEPWFDGAAAVELPPQRRGVSLVFQSLALFPHLTALENVEYGIDRAVPRPERLRRAQDMLERMKVAHVSARKPRTFSGGEAQRVALARAFARAPRAVLLDEAFSAMDAPLRAELHAEVSALVSELNVPTLQVTHDRAEARTMGTRVALLDRGQLVAVGPIDEHLPATAGAGRTP